jgi:hypothetical protein
MLSREFTPLFVLFFLISTVGGNEPRVTFRAQMLAFDGNEGIAIAGKSGTNVLFAK